MQKASLAGGSGVMHYLIVVALFLAVGLASNEASAQSAEVQAQQTINKAGKSCPSVTDMRGASKIQGGDAVVIAVACSDGSQHALKLITSTNQLSYISSCSNLEARNTKFECF